MFENVKIAYRFERHAVWYVREVPGQGGKDWGYVDKVEKATKLSPYWQRRFAADCRYVGRTAHFL